MTVSGSSIFQSCTASGTGGALSVKGNLRLGNASFQNCSAPAASVFTVLYNASMDVVDIHGVTGAEARCGEALRVRFAQCAHAPSCRLEGQYPGSEVLASFSQTLFARRQFTSVLHVHSFTPDRKLHPLKTTNPDLLNRRSANSCRNSSTSSPQVCGHKRHRLWPRSGLSAPGRCCHLRGGAGG